MGRYLLKICQRELNLKNTLINGQCFNWAEIQTGLFRGVLYRQFVEVSRIDPSTIRVDVEPDNSLGFKATLLNYFNNHVNIEQLNKQWSKTDLHMAFVCERLPGIRILRQDPWQCTISFICSSNNNIGRITKLLHSLRGRYGKLVHESKQHKYYGFPTLSQLSCAKAEQLREMGFGYRAEYIIQAVKKINDKGGESWLSELRNKKYQEIKDELVNLKGIGRKVADCICLFSMDCHEAVPVDTHVFQLAKKLGYIAQQHDKKSMSDTLYNKIAACYVKRFGIYAGWAQQVLFAGDLVMYKNKMEETTQTQLPEDSQQQKQSLNATRKKR